MFKKAIFAAAFLAAFITPAFAAGLNSGMSGKEAQIYLNGSRINARACIAEDGAVFLPVRSVFEALGYKVLFSGTDKRPAVTAQDGKNKLTLNINEQTIEKNGHSYCLNAPYGMAENGLLLYKGSAYLEAGLFSEALGFSKSFRGTDGYISIRSAGANRITVNNMKLCSENEDIKVTVQYPQLDGLPSYDAQVGINSILRRAASSAIDEGLGFAYDLKTAKQSNPGFTAKCETNFNYRITYNQNGILSVVLLDYQYSGGAHGGTLQSSYTFDLATGKVLELSDLTVKNSAYTSYINSAIRKEIDKRVAAGDLYEFSDSRFETVGDRPDFYLSGDSVVFYFQEYEHFPYAAGIQEFPVLYSGLGGMLTSGYGFLTYPDNELLRDVKNTVPAGQTVNVELRRNPTTGFTWHYSLGNEGILEKSAESYTPDSALTGSGGVCVWSFKALKAGQAKLIFKYYRDADGEASATAGNTVLYNVTVR
ncbi:MAG: protease inhibitor I42 family protein [Bacillota bacterium]|nr:protease inhibitor I42 family protein [Bacillota bacterium]